MRRWLGSATASELVARLDAVDQRRQPGSADVAQRSLAEGAALVAAGQARRGGGGLPRGSGSLRRPGRPAHAQAVELLVLQLSLTRQEADCARTARNELPNLPPGTSLATVAGTGPRVRAPAAGDGRRTGCRRRPVLEARVVELTRDTSVPMLADDRSGLFQTLVEARRERGDAAGALAAAADWANYLEGEAARAKTADARAVFDSHRLAAYLALGQPERAVPMLEQSRKDFPQGLQPLGPARGGLPGHAPAGAGPQLLPSRQKRLVYGPRTLRVLLTKAEAQAALGDRAGAKATLARADELVASLPDAQRGPWMVSAIDSKRKALLAVAIGPRRSQRGHGAATRRRPAGARLRGAESGHATSSPPRPGARA